MLALRILAILVWVPLAAESAELDTEGVCAYAAGRFGAAAVRLDHPIHEPRRRNAEAAAIAAYLLGRTFQELGVRGLALHHLAEAERDGDLEWRVLARRELARIHFQAGNPIAVIAARGRTEGTTDPETSYLAGLAAAKQRDWPRAAEILAEVPTTSGFYPYARYARAQAEAAGGDFQAALADLEEVIRRPPVPRELRPMMQLAARELLEPAGGESGTLRVSFQSPEHSVSLRDRAELLRGKILYLEGRSAEARTAFAAVVGDGPTGLEAVRGLVLTGAVGDAGAALETSRSRPIESAIALLAKAVAAEDREDYRASWHIRSRLRDLVESRLHALERLGDDPALEERFAADLAEFWLRVRRARSQQRWQEESALVETSCSFGPPVSPLDAAFQPHDEIFYAMWGRSRMDPSLERLAALMARGEELIADLDAPPEHRLFWEFWRPEHDERLRTALLLLRLTNLELQVADHFHDFAGLAEDEYRGRKRAVIEAATAELHALYVDRSPGMLGSSASSESRVDGHGLEMLQAVDASPAHTTDTVIVMLREHVDLLAEMRSALGQSRDNRVPQAIGRMREAARALTTGLSRRTRRLIEEARSEQVAFFDRIEADNQGSLSRLYARLGAGD